MYLEIGSGKNRFSQSKIRNAMLHAEARAVDRAKLFHGERLGIKLRPRKPKRKGHHGWRHQSINR